MAIGTPVLIASDIGQGFPAVLTVDAAAAAGLTLVLRVALRDNGGGAATVVTVADAAGNTWVRTVFGASGSGITKAQIFRCSNNLALAISDTITISVSGGAGTDYWAAEVHSIDGLDLSDPVDQTNSATATNGTPSSGSITTTVDDTIIIGAVGVASAAGDADPSQDTNSFLPSSGFFIETTAGTDGGNRQLIQGYRILSATGTLDYSPTLATSLRLWVALVASLKAAAGGGLSIPVAMHHYRSMRND